MPGIIGPSGRRLSVNNEAAEDMVMEKWCGMEREAELVVGRVLPTTLWRIAIARATIRWRGWLQRQLSAERHEPLMLQQLDCTGTFIRIAIEALLQKCDACVAQLFVGG